MKENKSYENYFYESEKRDYEFIKREFPDFDYINCNNKKIEWKIQDFSDTGHLNGRGAENLAKNIKIDYKYQNQ